MNATEIAREIERESLQSEIKGKERLEVENSEYEGNRGSMIREGELRPTEEAEYKLFLEGFINSGRRPHFIDVIFGNAQEDSPWVHTATRSFTLLPTYGASALSILVPKGVDIQGLEHPGHSSLYFMEDYRVMSSPPILFRGMF